MMGNYGDWSPVGMGLMGLFMIAFWALVIFGIVWLVRTVSRPQATPGATQDVPSATDVLDRRFASGEIDEAEYEHRLAVLTGHGKAPPT